MGCSQRAQCVEIKVGKVHAILAGLACLQSRTEGGNVTSAKSPSHSSTKGMLVHMAVNRNSDSSRFTGQLAEDIDRLEWLDE